MKNALASVKAGFGVPMVVAVVSLSDARDCVVMEHNDGGWSTAIAAQLLLVINKNGGFRSSSTRCLAQRLLRHDQCLLRPRQTCFL